MLLLWFLSCYYHGYYPHEGREQRKWGQSFGLFTFIISLSLQLSHLGYSSFNSIDCTHTYTPTNSCYQLSKWVSVSSLCNTGGIHCLLLLWLPWLQGLRHSEDHRGQREVSAALRHWGQDVGVWGEHQRQEALWHHQHRARECQVPAGIQAARERGRVGGARGGVACYYKLLSAYLLSVMCCWTFS